jgi:hypothetical protein
LTPHQLALCFRHRTNYNHDYNLLPEKLRHLNAGIMKSNLLNTSLQFALVKTVLFTLFCLTGFAAPPDAQQQTDFVTLTVTSSCASAGVRLSGGEALKTPFSKLLPRGQPLTFEVLDSNLPGCGALPVVTNFRRLVVNKEFLPKGQSVANLAMEQDTSVFVHYGSQDAPLVTLSVWSTCPTTRTGVRISENSLAGQTGNFITHFDATFIQGQSVSLEAAQILSHCGDLPATFSFFYWSAAGKVYPQEQIMIDLPLDKYTTAYAHYGGVPPTLRLASFQLLRNGNPVDFIREDDKLKKYSVLLNADSFPQDTKVSINGMETEIIRSSATQLEVKLSGKRAKTSGIILLVAIAPVNQIFTPAPVEVRRY